MPLILNAILSDQIVVSTGTYLYNVNTGHETILFWNITGPITGTLPTIQFTLQEVDLSDQTSPIGQTITSPVVSTTGVGNITLELGISTFILVTWTVTGDSASFGGTNLAIFSTTLSLVPIVG